MTSIITPPPDIRNVIDKTAIYVTKNGKEFEDRIFQKERHNPKFSFLHANDPYHRYYQSRLQALVEGGQDVMNQMSQAVQRAEVTDAKSEGRAEKVEEMSPPEPEPLLFTLDLPNISPLDLDIIKLTAQYVARNGKEFQGKITRKESGNVQFDFLKPSHSLNRLYNRLVEQFSKIILPTEAMKEKVKAGQSKHVIFDSLMPRLEYERWMDNKRKKDAANADKEREAFLRINWNDFAIVETIDFTPADKEIELPKPLDLNSITSMTLLQRQELWGGKLLSANRIIDETGADDQEMQIDEPQTKKSTYTSQTGEALNVRYDYKPKAAQQPISGSSDLVTCSICGQQIPSSQIQEHMRVELLDSKWAEQKKAHLAKHVDTNIVESGNDVSRNLANLSRARTDIFGPSSTAGPTQASSFDRQSALNSKVIWDGTSNSAAAAYREAAIKSKDQVLQEMEQLERQGDITLDPSHGIGPRQQPQAYPPPGYPPQMAYPPYYGYPPGYFPPQGYYPGQMMHPMPPGQMHPMPPPAQGTPNQYHYPYPFYPGQAPPPPPGAPQQQPPNQ